MKKESPLDRDWRIELKISERRATQTFLKNYFVSAIFALIITLTLFAIKLLMAELEDGDFATAFMFWAGFTSFGPLIIHEAYYSTSRESRMGRLLTRLTRWMDS